MKKSRKRAPVPVPAGKERASGQTWQWIPIGLILLLTILVYAQVHSFSFLMVDDTNYVADPISKNHPNHTVVNGYVVGGLTASSISWALTTTHASNWHPLTWISHMLDCQLFGLNAGAHHLTNLLLHLLSTLLLFIVLRRATASIWRSAFVAGLFALHPLHVESVAWVAERKDVLSTVFWMLTMLAYVYYTEQVSFRRYILVFAALALGLMAKPMLVSLPVVLLLLDYWPLRRPDGWKRLVLEKTPLFALAIASCALTFLAQRAGGAVQALSHYPLSVRLANSIVGYVSYLTKMFLPVDLGPLYPHPGNTLPEWMVIASVAVFATLTAAAIVLARRAPYLTAGWLFYIVTLVPVIQLVQVGQQGVADRYTYVPLIGIFIAIAWLVPEALAHVIRRRPAAGIGLVAAGAAVLLILSIMAHAQVGIWRNDESYNRQLLKATHNHPLSRALYAKYLAGQGRVEEANKEVEAILRQYPNLPEAHDAHAYTLVLLGRTEAGIAELKRSLKLRPDSARNVSNMGVLYNNLGRLDEAIEWTTKAVEMSPGAADWRVNLARALAADGRTDEAIEEYERALAIDPDIGVAQRDLGLMLYQKEDMTGAIQRLKLAVAVNPFDATSRWLLGSVLQRQGYNNEAIIHLNEAVKLRPTWGDAHAALAMALNGAGLTDQARREFELARKYGAKIVPAPGQ